MKNKKSEITNNSVLKHFLFYFYRKDRQETQSFRTKTKEIPLRALRTLRFINRLDTGSRKNIFSHISLLFILGSLLFIFSGCQRIREAYGGGQNDADIEALAAPIFAVNTIPAASGSIQDYLALSGDINASSAVDVFSDAAGRINRIYVSAGSQVRRGDPIAAVDPSRPGMEFVAHIVRAPVAGTVTALPAQLGMTISQAVPLARISGAGGLEIRLNVAERFISRISLNQSCEISVDAWPGEVFRGSVSEMSPTVDTMTRTMEIRVSVDNPGAMLRAGMFARARIITERREEVVKIPVGAMISRFGEQYIFTVDYSDPEAPLAIRRNIIPGIIIDGVMEVRQGLRPNEEVVIRGMSLLEDLSRINIVERLAPVSAN